MGFNTNGERRSSNLRLKPTASLAGVKRSWALGDILKHQLAIVACLVVPKASSCEVATNRSFWASKDQDVEAEVTLPSFGTAASTVKEANIPAELAPKVTRKDYRNVNSDCQQQTFLSMFCRVPQSSQQDNINILILAQVMASRKKVEHGDSCPPKDEGAIHR